ncbi:hypothetical protein [Algoriphagus sp. CAU 1675]|uniref:hypothetical protein n=1 Tax=Algoriphagus sp. CAU 1675 TaxID=3032597 RepID=UPI0023DA4030|nr:hypothetical protein [Algoriphagus sp. CAU 1675]MDF2157338.1 hypothetical protein [Algoriphagus sp. CAU 1675]
MKLQLNQLYLPLFALASFTFLFSCGKGAEESQISDQATYSFAKIDSFEVNNLTRVFIRDYSPEEKRYLGYSIVEDELLEISENGEILNRVKKKGEGPGLYGNWNPIGICFGPNGERVAELPFAIFTFDKNYDVVHEQRIQSPLPIRTFGPMGRTEYFQKQDSTFYLVGPSNYLSAHYLIRNEEGLDTLKNFYQINIESGEMKSVVPYLENSIYKQGKDIYQELMTKSFFVDKVKNELILIHAIEKEIEVYSLPDLAFKKSVPLKYSAFLSYSPLPIETAPNDERINTLRFLAGRNKKLINLGDGMYLLQYYKGISEAAYQSRIAENPLYYPLDDIKEQGILLVKEGKQLDLELNSISGTILFGMGNNRFLVQDPENPDIEEEVTRFSIYQVQTN